MNTIIVATRFDGTQQLFTWQQIWEITARYKQAWRQYKALTHYCAWNGIKDLDVYQMDGKKRNWLVSCTNASEYKEA